MRIGLVDVDSHNFPNLPLMKISAYHKSNGDTVEWCNYFESYDKVYVAKVFGEEYEPSLLPQINAKEVIFGGTGYAITIENGIEVYHKNKDIVLPDEVEHMYPDYGLYPELTKDKAFGFLTRGSPNNCPFCVVSQKEGRVSRKVADLSEFWRGQKHIELLDPNILACKDHLDLLKQLVDSDARVNFNQGLDARFITEENVELLTKIKTDMVHFAFDLMKNKDRIVKGLKLFRDRSNVNIRRSIVYVLTNFNTSIQEDLWRVNKVRALGYYPDVRIYRKNSLPKRHILRDLQRWCNNRFIYNSISFEEYSPRGKTMKEEYGDILGGN